MMAVTGKVATAPRAQAAAAAASRGERAETEFPSSWASPAEGGRVTMVDHPASTARSGSFTDVLQKSLPLI
jgi:hypothetical protein